MNNSLKNYHYKVLVVDDEKDICDLMAMILQKMEIATTAVKSVHQAQNALMKEQFDFCVTDFKLSDGTGLDLLQWIQQKKFELPVAVFTAYGSVDLATQALKQGAYDFVTKPVNVQMVRRLVESAIQLKGDLSDSKESQYEIIGQSTIIQSLLTMVDKVARSQAPILIRGPSGSGKELIAHRIHERSSRRKKAFIAVNCGAIPSELMESEFFGYKKGAFTGAVNDKKGLFQLADGGTLFLDEVAELPLNMQVKLLRVIQEKSVRPIGGVDEELVDIRLISATHQNLGKLLNEGKFREDLFYRLHVIELNVPALHERKEDIPLLVSYLLNKICQQWKRPLVQIQEEGLSLLQDYAFPGNIRELENILERAVTLCDDDCIRKKDILLPEKESTNTVREELYDVVNDVAKSTIEAVLARCKGNKERAAKELGISLRALRYRLKKLHIGED